MKYKNLYKCFSIPAFMTVLALISFFTCVEEYRFSINIVLLVLLIVHMFVLRSVMNEVDRKPKNH